jgi:glycosyltransferase involved in cell wall biosynthesis
MARVTLYYPWIYLKSGIERTILELERRSRHDIRIVTSRYEPNSTFEEFGNLKVEELDRVSVKRTYWEVAKAAWKIGNIRLDDKGHDILLICCDGIGPWLLLRNRSRPAVNLCFTPLRAVYDAAYRARLMETSPPRRLLRTMAEAAFRRIDRLAWTRFASVICNSRTTRDRVVQGRLYPAEKIIVAYPGVDSRSIERGRRFDRYFFLPGRIMWTKNIELAIAAFGQFRAAHHDFELVIAGMVDEKSRQYFAKLQDMAEPIGGIRFEIDVSDGRMQDLYGNCTCVLLSAFNEDQGLTPLEGMARGKPCIAVDRGGPRESVLHGRTGFLEEPTPEAFAAAMARIAEEAGLAERMGNAGLDHVRNFTWDRFIAVLDAEIDRLAPPHAADDRSYSCRNHSSPYDPTMT